jgi:hypothetical protein
MDTEPQQPTEPQEASGPPSSEVFKAYGSGSHNGWPADLFDLLRNRRRRAQRRRPSITSGYNGVGGYLLQFTCWTRACLILAAVPHSPLALAHLATSGRYPDKLLVSADQMGISLPSGFAVPTQRSGGSIPIVGDPAWAQTIGSRLMAAHHIAAKST